MVNGQRVDALLVGKPKQIKNGRWILYSNPNAVSFEEAIDRKCESAHGRPTYKLPFF